MNFYPNNEIEEVEASSLLESILKESNTKKRVKKLNELVEVHPLFIDARIHLAYSRSKKEIELALLKLLDDVEKELNNMSLFQENLGSFGLIEETKKEIEVLYYLFDYYLSLGNYKKCYEISKKALLLDYTDTYSLRYYNLVLAYIYDSENYQSIKSNLGDDISTINLMMSVLDNSKNIEEIKNILKEYHPHFFTYLNGEEEVEDEVLESIESMVSIPFGQIEEELYSLSLFTNLLESEYENVISKLLY